MKKMKLTYIDVRKSCIIIYLWNDEGSDSLYNQINDKCLFTTCANTFIGSRARGEFSSDSDYDLLIITQDTFDPRTKMNWESKIRKALVNELSLPFDVIIQSKKEVSEKKDLYGHIVYYAMKEAVEIWGTMKEIILSNGLKKQNTI